MAELLDFPRLRERTDNAFRAALIRQAEAAALNADNIAAVISIESGFLPNIQNSQGHNMLGLIQFWRDGFPAVAKRAGMKVKWEDLRTMSAAEQVPLVIAYYQGTRVNADSSPTDYYVATFMPVFVGRPGSMVLAKLNSKEVIPGTTRTQGAYYAANVSLDWDRDGKITIDDITARMNSLMGPAQQRPRVLVDLGEAREAMPAQVGSLGWVLASVFIFYALKRSGKK